MHYQHRILIFVGHWKTFSSKILGTLSGNHGILILQKGNDTENPINYMNLLRLNDLLHINLIMNVAILSIYYDFKLRFMLGFKVLTYFDHELLHPLLFFFLLLDSLHFNIISVHSVAILMHSSLLLVSLIWQSLFRGCRSAPILIITLVFLILL